MRALPIVVAVVLLLAGCSAPAATPNDGSSPGPMAETTASGTAGSAVDPTANGSAGGTTTGASAEEGTDTDPDEDVQGWEAGYWYDEPLSVTVADGLNESEREAVVARATARVEHLRGIEFEEPVPVTVIGRDEYRNDSGGGGGGTADPTFDSVRYRALFLVGDRGNATREAEETRQASVLGYYDVREDRIVIVSDAATPTLDEVTLAQELTHAYQFRHFALRLPRDPTDDEVRGLVALVEGDANLVDRLYERHCEDAWQCVGSSGSDGEDAGGGNGAGEGDGGESETRSGVHMGLYLLNFFPYAEGEELVREARADGGWPAVEALYESPPRSSEQVIHPDRIGEDQPERVAVPDLSEDSWHPVRRPDGGRTATIGEAGIATMFMYTTYDDRPGSVVPRSAFLNLEDGTVNATEPLDYRLNYSTGWAGDALAVFERGNGSTGYVWRTKWDDDGEAREFADGYRSLLSYRGGTDRGSYWHLDGDFGGAYALRVDGRTVTIVHTSSKGGLSELWPGTATS